MDFVLQLKSVADKDDKTEIERLWKKQLDGITALKDAQIDSKRIVKTKMVAVLIEQLKI